MTRKYDQPVPANQQPPDPNAAAAAAQAATPDACYGAGVYDLDEQDSTPPKPQ